MERFSLPLVSPSYWREELLRMRFPVTVNPFRSSRTRIFHFHLFLCQSVRSQHRDRERTCCPRLCMPLCIVCGKPNHYYFLSANSYLSRLESASGRVVCLHRKLERLLSATASDEPTPLVSVLGEISARRL